MSLLWRLLDWRRELLYGLVATMEACWLYPWLAISLGWLAGAEYIVSPAIVLFWLLLASAVVRLLNNLELSLLRQQSLTVGLGLLAILLGLRLTLYRGYGLLSLRWLGMLARDIAAVRLAVPPPLWIFFAGLFVWWRGIRLGQDPLGAGNVGWRFRVGVVALMLCLTLGALAGSAPYIPFLIAFFYFGLLAIALSRVSELDDARGGIRTPFNRTWLAILALSVGLVVLLGLSASSLLSLDNLEAASRTLRPLTGLLSLLLRGIVAALLFLVVNLGSLLGRLLRALFGRPQEMEEMPLLSLDRLRELEEQLDISRYLGLIKVSRDVTLALVVLVAVAAVWLAVRRWHRREQKSREVLRESIWSSQDFLDDLAGLLRGGWQRLKEGAADGLARLRGERYSLTSIRRIYASLNKLAAEHGYPRKEIQTPNEYLTVLCQAWPTCAEEVAWLTKAYIRAHYGVQKDTEASLRQARAVWELLSATKPMPPPK